MRSYATLGRDVDAVMIPYGGTVRIPQGATVSIAQALGGSFTVITPEGMMARIDGQDADALGEEHAAEAAAARQAESEAAASKSVEERVWDALKTCYDPEIPVNIVDLGLVYSCELTPLEAGGQKAAVRFTLTAPGCGMGDYLRRDMEMKLAQIEGIGEVDVQVVLEPAWDQSRMSDAARLQLGLM
jgi:probable FeS assembly SUF system protein SufT